MVPRGVALVVDAEGACALGNRWHHRCRSHLAAREAARITQLELWFLLVGAFRPAIHKDVVDHGFDSAQNSFVQSYGATALDASLLMIPMVGFLPPSDPRVRGTVAAVEQRLMRDGLVLRYHTETGADGLPPGEGAFLACSFWLADNYVLQGRNGGGGACFDPLFSFHNDVGC